MSLEHVVLGLLKDRTMTGYDIKKVMQLSPIMHWSGNNNQVYRILASLSNEGFVESESLVQNNAPTKKIYSLTSRGLAELKRWVRIAEDSYEIRNAFLLRFANADVLSVNEICNMLIQHEWQLKMLQNTHEENKPHDSVENDLSSLIGAMVQENIKRHYENEISWVRSSLSLLENFVEHVQSNEESECQDSRKRYERVVGVQNEFLFYGRNELAFANVSQLVSDCLGEKVNSILINETNLQESSLLRSSEEALDLIAKLVALQIKTAIVFDNIGVHNRFTEICAETNAGDWIGLFMDTKMAKRWIATDYEEA